MAFENVHGHFVDVEAWRSKTDDALAGDALEQPAGRHYFFLFPRRRQATEVVRMRHRVVRQLVAGGHHAAQHVGLQLLQPDVVADHEKRAADAGFREELEKPIDDAVVVAVAIGMREAKRDRVVVETFEVDGDVGQLQGTNECTLATRDESRGGLLTPWRTPKKRVRHLLNRSRHKVSDTFFRLAPRLASVPSRL